MSFFRNRPYLNSHPLAFWFSIGVALSGLVNLVFPQLVDQSAISLAMPDWLITVFNISWTMGGAFSAYGLYTDRRDVEAGGMTLLASGLLTFYVAQVYVRSTAALSAIFLITLAIGCAHRAYHLATIGHDLYLHLPGEYTDQPSDDDLEVPEFAKPRDVNDV